MTWRDRILADGSDRDAWKTARHGVIGASDAKGFSKLESVPLYVKAKLSREVYTGNVFTENGYRFEPMFCGWAGAEHNTALIHAPDNPGFAATPDGIRETPNGLVLVECKIKHVTPEKRTKGPTLPELRQIAWQFRVIPEAAGLMWVWGDIDKDAHTDDLIEDEPRHLYFTPDDPRIRELTDQIEPIAQAVLTELTAALAFEKELALD